MLRFDGQVALVTGAGRGMGRSHALALAARGAAVVVNDAGGEVDGTGQSARPAEQVVAAIETAGGHAVADPGTVTSQRDAEAMVERALSAFGRIDVVVNNAG